MGTKTTLFLVLVIFSIVLIPVLSAEINDFKVSSKIYEKFREKKESINVIISSEDKAELESLLNKEEIKVNYISKTRNFVSATINEEDIEILKQDENVNSISVEPEMVLFLQDSTSIVNATRTWPVQINNNNITGEGETICIIDTGVNYSHPDLGSCLGSGCKVLGGYAFYNPINSSNPYDIMDDHNHGTHVAGIAAANGNIKGVAPGANIIAIKACGPTNSCGWGEIIDGINWCVDNSTLYNISVISMSIGSLSLYPSYCDSDPDFSEMVAAINAAVAKNISVISAAGNNNNYTAISVPACIQNATAVGATYKNDNIYYNRNNITDLLAPGISINSTSRSGTYMSMSGTSMSTPHVSGAFALVRQFKKQEIGQEMKPEEIEQTLKDTGFPVYDGASGLTFSRIDSLSAILSLDETAPQVKLVQPQDSLATAERNLTFVCNASDLQLKNITIRIWNSSDLYHEDTEYASGTFYQMGWALDNLPYDNYEWQCESCDMKELCEVTGNFSLTISDDYLTISLLNPSNGFYTNDSTQSFNCSASSINELTNITFLLWNSSNLVYNETRNINGLENETAFDYNFSEQGNYEWNCLAKNEENNQSSANSNFNLVYDATTPNVTLLSPENGASYVSASQQITFSYNVTDNTEMNCSLIVNNASLEIKSATAGVNSFTRSFVPGAYNWSINCIDLAGNEASSEQRSFSVTAPEPPPAPPSGGGGGGGGTAKTIVKQECQESWKCGGWNECVGGFQTRNCVDDNNCNTTRNKPSERQPCVEIQEQEEEKEPEKETSVPITGAIIEGIRNNAPLIITGAVAVIVLLLVFRLIRVRRKARFKNIQ